MKQAFLFQIAVIFILSTCRLSIDCSTAYSQVVSKPKKSETTTAPSSKESRGSVIEGTVIYHADPKRRWRYARFYVQRASKGYLAEALVCLRSRNLKKKKFPHKPTTFVVDQKNHNFTPETSAIRVGDRVKFTNSDYQVHNVYSTDSRSLFDATMGAEGHSIQKFDKGSGINRPIFVGCRFHGSMRAWIYVMEHPFYQITSSNGKFRLEKIPPGNYYLEMRHPAGRLSWTKKIEVKAEQNIRIDVHVSPDNLKK